MPFYFRKSVSAGPFRFNFSNGGVGVSVGVKGLRIGTGPRGHYVHAGRNGFYYRASLGRPGVHNRPATQHDDIVTYQTPDGMIPISSDDALVMQDAAFADILAEINSKNQQVPMATILGLIGASFCFLCFMIVGPGAVPALFLPPAAWLAGRWFDSYRRVVVLFYELDDTREHAYTQLVTAFDQLAACSGKWHIEAGKAVHDLTTWKREAGASHLVTRKPLSLGYQLPAILTCNVTPPMFRAGHRTFHFLPDVVLVQDATGFGAVAYDALSISHQHSNFIETEAVPADAKISHYTWQHPNKSGGPDRRFRSNRQLPVCRYEAMHFRSNSGINELVEFSRTGLAQGLVAAVAAVPRNLSLDKSRLLPSLNSADHDAIPSPAQPGGSSNVLIVAASAGIMAILSAVLICVLPHRSFAQPTAEPPVADIAYADETAWITAKQLNCRADSDAASAVVRTYDRRDPVHIIGRRMDWAQVEDQGGNCWVSARYLAQGPRTVPKVHLPVSPSAIETPSDAMADKTVADQSVGKSDETPTLAYGDVDTDDLSDATRDPAIANAIASKTLVAIESGRAELWRASGSMGYVVPSEASAQAGQTCRSVYATIIRGDTQLRSVPARWCKSNDGATWRAAD
ncbi:DUF4236 domain-containing protein [Rhizorhabdus sp.]|uniref:DUF4236 domain-containing protein n=1 Tax=Rhizorhabdus sp. TaxID=1968843 RepID=UPI0019C67C5E|nr:DUF4236 domain-containing protein [Rhizorhabdus sp.]MBD3762841.1 DUF4236 domain-containing protein [Rhizorhabdus sp.]